MGNFKFLILINPIHDIIHNLKNNIFPDIQSFGCWHIHWLEWINRFFIILLLLFIHFLHLYQILLFLLLHLLFFYYFFIFTSSFSYHWCCYIYFDLWLFLLLWLFWFLYSYLSPFFYLRLLLAPLLVGFRLFFS